MLAGAGRGEREPATVQSVERALTVLEILAERGVAGVTEIAVELGVHKSTAFRLVTLPLAMPGLVAGTLLTFIPASGDYINSELLGNPRTRMIGNDIQDLFQATDVPRAAALSVTLMVVIVAMVLVYVRKSGAEDLV